MLRIKRGTSFRFHSSLSHSKWASLWLTVRLKKSKGHFSLIHTSIIKDIFYNWYPLLSVYLENSCTMTSVLWITALGFLGGRQSNYCTFDIVSTWVVHFATHCNYPFCTLLWLLLHPIDCHTLILCWFSDLSDPWNLIALTSTDLIWGGSLLEV